MYLEHFCLKELPFSLTPNTHYFCDLPGHMAAYNVLKFSLRSGESLVKVIGEVGAGKTLLCRKVLNGMDNNFVLAYIPNPNLSPAGMHKTIARELSIPLTEDMDDGTILEKITELLIYLRRKGKKVALLIDEAQTLSDESLEALRLLTNIETESEKLLQIVLFAQPELDVRLNQHRFRQLKQRISFSHYLGPIDKRHLDTYLSYRLATAGHTKGELFNRSARDLLYRSSHGIPRVINILSHKAMLVAYGRGRKKISRAEVAEAVRDSLSLTASASSKQQGGMLTISLTVLVIALLAGFAYFYQLSPLFSLGQ
jgi:MSHA biogenesis protein MshM